MSTVARPSTIEVLLATVAAQEMECGRMVVITAFLNSVLGTVDDDHLLRATIIKPT